MKKNDKIKILFSIFLLCIILTWFIAGGSYSNGEYSAGDITRAGIYDIIIVLFYSLYYKSVNIFYLFLAGGCYGVLKNTKSYQKLVDKTVEKVRGKETIFHLITTFLIALFISFSKEILPVFIFVPFIITIMLKCNKDRITAISSAIGGILIGVAGLTFGTYGVSNYMSSLSLKYTQGIGFKIALFLISYVLYNLFAILYMNKQYKDVDEEEYNAYNTEEFVEKKKRNKTKLWPTITMFALLIIVLILGYINWNTSFGIEFFKDIEENFEKLEVSGIPIFYSLVGSTSAFGEWGDLLGAGTIFLITTIIISFMNKVKLDNFINDFTDGMKDMIKVVIIYILVNAIFITSMWYSWPINLVNTILGNHKFNMFLFMIIGLIVSFFLVESDYIGYVFGDFLAASYSGNAMHAVLILNTASSLILAISPTSFIVMMSLTLLDIPYKDWLKFIWKYVLSLLIVSLIIFAVMIYM